MRLISNNDPVRTMGLLLPLLLGSLTGCDHEVDEPTPLDPATAPRAPVDRFSEAAGTLFVRDATNQLPGPDVPVDFDVPPFITQSLGPGGEVVRYYNFDVQPERPAILYRVYREGESTPVEGQLPIIDVIPGDEGYSDFWRIYRVIAPPGYVANTVTSFDAVYEADLGFDATDEVVNCPAVPEGSTASARYGGAAATQVLAWYRDQIVTLLTFEEASLSVTQDGLVPMAPIYVCFNINPDQPGGGPPAGFVTEPGTVQTHNVISALPSGPDYSPLWAVTVVHNAAFPAVGDLATAEAATRLGENVAQVNCPVVYP